jgi:hypothetical protein
MTRRKARPRSANDILEAIPGECGPRELARILDVSSHTPKLWRDQNVGPTYREQNGRITYDAR